MKWALCTKIFNCVLEKFICLFRLPHKTPSLFCFLFSLWEWDLPPLSLSCRLRVPVIFEACLLLSSVNPPVFWQLSRLAEISFPCLHGLPFSVVTISCHVQALFPSSFNCHGSLHFGLPVWYFLCESDTRLAFCPGPLAFWIKTSWSLLLWSVEPCEAFR